MKLFRLFVYVGIAGFILFLFKAGKNLMFIEDPMLNLEVMIIGIAVLLLHFLLVAAYCLWYAHNAIIVCSRRPDPPPERKVKRKNNRATQGLLFCIN